MPSKQQCNLCGESKYQGKGNLPKGQYRCQPCRRIKPSPTGPQGKPHKQIKPRQCPECLKTFSKKGKQLCCSIKCAQARRYRLGYSPLNQHTADPDWVRTKPQDPNWIRAKNAPGLKERPRRALLKQWIAQGRSCFYCDAKPVSVDHVIPLVLGGNNYEGNLVPACKWCNSSKGSLLLIEWKIKQSFKEQTFCISTST